MKRIITLIIAISLTLGNMIAQQSNKKILLTKTHNEDIQYENLHINTLLQTYNKTSSTHLVGDIYLRVNSNDKTIAEFYIDNDQTEKEYYTKIYKNYFITFLIENNNKYLILEQSQFGKPFALSSNGNATIGSKEDIVEIEITDFYQEQGYDSPPEDNDRSYFDDVFYTLKVKMRDVTKNISFYSSEVKDNYTIDIGNHSILILSDKCKNSSSLIEMVINKKEAK